MEHILEGAKIVFGDRRYRKHIVVPWLWSATIFVAAIVLGYFLMVPWVQSLITGEAWFSGPLKALVALAYFVLWIFAAGFVFLTITSLTSSFLWEDLSQKVEEQITGKAAPRCTLPFRRVLMDSLTRGAFSIFAALLSLFCGWVLPFVGPVILAGWVGLLDYTSPAFLRYDRTVGRQWPVATRMKGWFGFQLLSGLLTLLPFVNVLLLPALVAGGTVMAVKSRALELEKG